jgi:hypothetical protein
MSTSRDPVRLVLDPACPDSERGLLAEDANMAPPRGAQDRVWLALVGVIGAGAAGAAAAEATSGTVTATTTTTTTTAAKVEAGLTPVKIVGLAAVLAAMVAVATYLAGAWGGARKPVSVAPVPAAETPAAVPPQPPPLPPAGETPPVDDTPGPGDAERARPAPGARRSLRSAPTTTANPLRQEITLIKEARQALRDGHAARALRVLEECRRLHPEGVLVQERERLTVEALIGAGRAAEGSARAGEFLRRYPDSPHAGEVRELGRRAAGDR